MLQIDLEQRGGLAREMPTSYGAPPLRERIMTAANDIVPVWSDAEGHVPGEVWSSHFPKALEACRRNLALYGPGRCLTEPTRRTHQRP